MAYAYASGPTPIGILQITDELDIRGKAYNTTGNLILSGSTYVSGSLFAEGTFKTQAMWDDLRFPAAVGRVGATAPSFDTFIGGTKTYLFGAGSNDEIHFNAQFPHDWLTGSIISPHIHWSPMTADAGNTVWGMEYVFAPINGAFPASSTTLILTASAATVAKQHQINGFTNIDLSAHANTVSSMMLVRIWRAGTTGADNYGANAALLEFDIHYQRYRLGSENMTNGGP